MHRLVEALGQSRCWKETRGQDLVEYALLAGFVSLAFGATFPPLNNSISTVFSKLASMMAAA